MLRHFLLILGTFLCFALPQTLHAEAAPPSLTSVTITVQPGARQTFRGFGVSEFNYGSLGAGTFDRLTPERRAFLWRLLYRDLRLKTLRLWYDPATASTAPGKIDVSGFAKSYLRSGLIADARRNGITTLLLGPDHVPPYMLQNPADHSSRIRNDQIGAYAALLATIIQQVNAQGAGLDATGIANEPPWFDATQMAEAV
jgi:O-glycosyl hydrolase